MKIKIRLLNDNEKPPMDLLLLADPSKDTIEEYLKRGDCYVATDDSDNVIGVIVLLPTRPETLEIINIAVYEDYQGKGIGKQLVSFAIQKAKEKKIKTLEVGTGNSSIDQIAFYQKCGFRITGVDRDFFVRHYKEEIYENRIQCRDMIRFSMDLSNI
ncbi:MAG TPA: GNAT family N-acetyltransferase [Mobilitalea sp.]|nr:GNAT family N-acetyltransferase [Mobilitalea sp.]